MNDTSSWRAYCVVSDQHKQTLTVKLHWLRNWLVAASYIEQPSHTQNNTSKVNVEHPLHESAECSGIQLLVISFASVAGKSTQLHVLLYCLRRQCITPASLEVASTGGQVHIMLLHIVMKHYWNPRCTCKLSNLVPWTTEAIIIIEIKGTTSTIIKTACSHNHEYGRLRTRCK